MGGQIVTRLIIPYHYNLKRQGNGQQTHYYESAGKVENKVYLNSHYRKQ